MSKTSDLKQKIRRKIRDMKYIQKTATENNLYKARLVGRTVRHIEPWSVFRVSLAFYLALWVIFIVVGGVLWGIAEAANLIDRLENFTADLLALESYNLPFFLIYFIYIFIGLALAFLATALTVLGCVIFNQVSGVLGGVRMLVLEEESLQLVGSEKRQHLQEDSNQQQTQEGL